MVRDERNIGMDYLSDPPPGDIRWMLPKPLRQLLVADVRDFLRRGSPLPRIALGVFAAYIEIMLVFVAAPTAATGNWRAAIACAAIAFLSGCVASYCFPGKKGPQ